MKEKEMVKFPKIDVFRTVIQEVAHKTRFLGVSEDNELMYDTEKELPTLTYRGSVKIHGSNGGVVFTWNPLTFEYDFHTQSRSRILSPTSDNAGFATFIHTRNMDELLRKVMIANPMDYTPETIAIFGEWCGGNIQDKAAVNGLDKMFVIFAIRIDGKWVNDLKMSQVEMPEARIYNILSFESHLVEVDFNNPRVAADKIAELVDKVEKACPVGLSFGKQGIGEGLVLKPINEGWESSKFWFKAKGDEHKGSRTREKVPVDIEKVNSIKELVDNIVTESRLNQGLDYLKEQGLEISRKNTGPYLKWLVNDVVAEELDTIVGNGFEPKELNGYISQKGRDWFFEKEANFDLTV